METESLRLAGVVEDSIVDGPGLRMTVFAQGCPHHCPGCHNPHTHDFAGGSPASVDALAKRYAKNPLLRGVTISGGEPFAQAAPLAVLAQRVRALGGTVWTYTGYTFEELTAPHAPASWAELLGQTDVLIDGRFELTQRTLELPFRGSANQRLLDVRQSLASGHAIECTKT